MEKESKQALSVLQLDHEIIDSTGTETRQNYSRMFVKAKVNKKLFTPTLNGIAASV